MLARCCGLLAATATLGGCTARSDFGGRAVHVSDSHRGDPGGSAECGDGTLDAGEGCDDGNTEPGDGCSSVCAVESGWHCGGVPALCRPDGHVYRSVELGATSALATGESNPLTIAGSLLVFATALPDDVGVGDVVRYGSELAFIEGRLSAREFLARDASGDEPQAVSSESGWMIFRAYTSLADAENGTENIAVGHDFDTWSDGADLVTAGLVWNIACYGGGSDAGVLVQDWNTDSGHYLRIFTPYLASDVGRSQRHAGTWDATRYFASTSVGSAFDIRDNYVRLEGLQGEQNANITYESAVFRIRDIGDEPGEVWVSHCIGRQVNKAEEDNWHAGLAIYEDVASTDLVSLRAYNNIFYDFDGAGSSYHGGMFINTVVRSYAYNNTIVNCHAGISGWGQNTSVKNNLMQNVVDSFYDMDVYYESSHNLTDAGDQVPGNPVLRGSVAFVDYAGKNFHLAASDTLALDAGADLISDPFIPIDDDIDGQPRSSGAFDIGADER